MAEAAAAESFLCPVCHEDLTEPKILPCTHVLCRECVLSTLKKKRRSGKYECPQCQTPIISGDTKDLEDFDALVDELPTDHATGVQVQCKKTLSSSSVCSICEGDCEAESFCFECDTKLCSMCTKVHSKMPCSSSHTVQNLGAITTEQLATRKQFPCSYHKEKSVEMYCSVDEKLVCSLCAASTHKKCDSVEEITSAVENKTQELQEMKERLLGKKASLSAEIENCDRQMTEAEAKFAEMQDRVVVVFSNIIRNFEDQKQKLLREICERKKIFLDEKLANKNNLEAVRSSAEAHVGSIDRLLSSAESHQAFLATFAELKSRLQKVEADKADTGDFTTGDVYFDEDMLNGLRRTAAVTGEVGDSPSKQDSSRLVHCVACNSVTEGTFQFVIEKPKRTGCSSLMSEPCFIRNMPWKLCVRPWYKEGEYLGLFLCSDVSSSSESWSCKVEADLRLLEADRLGQPEETELNCVFKRPSANRGFPKFIAMTELLDPENGYLKDNKLTFEVHIVADAPEGSF